MVAVQGDLHSFNLVDGVWKFVAKDVTVALPGEHTVKLKSVKILAAEAPAAKKKK